MMDRSIRGVRASEAAAVRVVSAGRTDPGRVREHNEDHVLLVPELELYVVADGMGGHSSGDVASALVGASLRNFFEATRGERLTADGQEEAGQTGPSLRLSRAIRKANSDVHEISTSHERHKGMGSTVVAVHVHEGLIHLAHVGDSRCYQVREGRIVQLTRDHSLINDALLMMPDLSPKQLAGLPKNVVTRALGMRPTVKVDLQTLEPQTGDVLLLCSDGLSGMVDDETVLDVLSLTENLDEACELLTALANEAGGKDNISIVLLRFEQAGEQEAPPSVWRGLDWQTLAKGRAVVTESEDVSIAAEEGYIEDPLSQLEGILEAGELERLRTGEVVELTRPRCPKCGTLIVDDNRFCTECGTPVAG
jgi:protein phosphatase